LSRSSYYAKNRVITKNKAKKTEDDKYIADKIKQIQSKHPSWGYPRITNWLKKREGIHINEKRIYRIMQENGLLIKNKPNKAVRSNNNKNKPKPDKPNQWWGTDMTKFLVPEIGWVYLIVVIDWFTKKCIGWHVDIFGRSKEWLKALDMAVINQCPNGSRGMRIHLMSDNGSQPTSLLYMNECKNLGIEQAFTSYNNPKGNADTERFIRTIKEECIWLNEFNYLLESREKIGASIEEYNNLYVHSSLDGISPVEFEKQWYEEQNIIDNLIKSVEKIAIDGRSFTEMEYSGLNYEKSYYALTAENTASAC
jgi:transposase InsO family protein